MSKELTTDNKEVDEMLKGDVTVTDLEYATTWKRVLNACRRTVGKQKLDKEPSDTWKASMLLAEHSPIRLLEFDWTFNKLRQWVTTHLVRHHEGVEKFVHTQREDRTKLPVPRDLLPQGARNDMDVSANAQALINISRKRLCMCASKETRTAWKKLKEEVRKVDDIMAEKMVPECIYRGFCPEFRAKCKYAYSDNYWENLAEYRNTNYQETWAPYGYDIEVSNLGHVKEKGLLLYPYRKGNQTFVETTMGEKEVSALVDHVYDCGTIRLDGNLFNNAVTNFKKSDAQSIGK